MKTEKHWEIVGLKTHNGINVPLFSLWSKKSCGIGEFTDLIPLIYWCKAVGFDVIQLLPLNDTGQESSPYSALSAFALNPIHLSLHRLPFAEETELKKFLPLNQEKRVDYKKVRALKEAFLRDYYKKHGQDLMQLPYFCQFRDENPWLESYALFKALRIEQDWKSFEHFSKEWQKPTLFGYTELLHVYKQEVDFHIFIQYLCFKEMQEVKKIAAENNIFLMGDIPILINRDSADVWMERHLFSLDYSAGAPPDMYNQEGQNWGFPIYNWQEMEKENYEWWKIRLKTAEKLYDIYRLDHIAGFFRIWSIPSHTSARNGFYIPGDDEAAKNQGEKILSMLLDSCTMLPIGEDLGNVPDFIRDSMQKLGIPGTKIMRWERVWKEDGRFIEGKDYPPLSLTSVSTHDSETLLLWWKEREEEASLYARSQKFPYNKKLSMQQQMGILKTSLHTKSLFHINLLQEYLSLIKDFTADNMEDERVNVPGIVSDKNWTCRYPSPIEEIVENQELKNIIQTLLSL
ncbi:MAG TPA: 4-alpha-glucanotransferase [Parachlamydiaceae bacterium]|nr:4-alpha-glucanotransferase [Parachlamydiaceae bacterium]